MKKSDRNIRSSVLITGGSGQVGRHLTSLLLSEGYKVSHLSRNINQFGRVRVYRWDPVKRIIDPEIFNGVDCLVHLAGENIGEKRWTKRRKEEIVNSRVDTAKLLHEVIMNNSINLKTYVSASAIGYYGSSTTERIFIEEDPPGAGFLGSLCREWEAAADQFSNSGIRTVKIRTAVVLGKESSSLAKFMIPARYGFMVMIGNGRQYMPWIHVADLSGIYLKAIEDSSLTGAYNAVAPHHISHSDFIRTLARMLKCSKVLFPVPGIFVKTFLGEMSDVVLKGSRVASGRITEAGYRFMFPKLDEALADSIEKDS